MSLPLPPSARQRRQRAGPPFFIGAIGLTLTLILWGALVARERAQVTKSTHVEAAAARNALRARFQTRLDALVRIAQRTQVRGTPTQDQWSVEVGLLAQHFPGFQEIAFIDPAGKLRAVVPHDANAPQIGSDAAIQPGRRLLMNEARASGRLAVLGPVDIPGPGDGALAIVPILAPPTTSPAGGAGTRSPAALRGYVFGLFRLDTLFDSILNELEAEESALRGYSFSLLHNGQEVYTHILAQREMESRWAYEVPLDLGSTHWMLRVWPSPGLFASLRSWLPEAALGAGALTSILLALAVYLAQEARRHAGVVERTNTQLIHEAAVRELAEKALQRQHKFQSALLQNLQEGIAACDAEGNLILVNAALRTFQGTRSAEGWAPIHGETAQQDLYAADGQTPLDPSQTPLARAFAGEIVHGQEVIIAPPDAPRRALVANGQAIYDEQRHKLGAVVALHDITARQRAEEELRLSAEQLERSNRELQDFASVASHDLQEPLRKIQAFGDRLKVRCAAQLDVEGRDYLERMQNAAGRMQRLIDDLLTFARVTTQAHPFEPTDLAQVTREVLSDLEARIEQLGAVVEVGPLPTLEADPMQMRQLLQNLIGNAMKFHRPEVPPHVRVTARMRENPEAAQSPGQTLVPVATECEIHVQDNGIGFDEKYLDRIFTVFQRLHSRSSYTGTGVGLAICRKIAERHGGSVTAHSTPGQGAEFVVILPLRQSAAPAGEAPLDELEIESETEGQPGPARTRTDNP
jgi:PAS domain S-box-containing protein